MIETDPKTCVNDLGLLAVPFYVCECVCVTMPPDDNSVWIGWTSKSVMQVGPLRCYGGTEGMWKWKSLSRVSPNSLLFTCQVPHFPWAQFHFITRMRETDTVDTDHLHAQQVLSFGTIAGDTAADLSRSEFIWTAESPSVRSSEWIMHTSSPHPTHSHRFDSEQRRCFSERRREGAKKGGKQKEGHEERASYKSHQCSLTTSTSTEWRNPDKPHGL